MAFSPMHTFRKHQKVLFAGLTILCMFVFVLSFGVGDLFQQAMTWFGGTKRDPELATLYGKDIHRVEFFQIQERRQLVNKFVVYALKSSQQAVFASIVFDPKEGIETWDLPKEEKTEIRKAVFQGDVRTLDFMASSLENRAKQTEAKKVHDLIWAITSAQLLDQLRAPGQLLFGGSTRPDSIFDFLIWQHQADRLGIRLDSKNVHELFTDMTHHNFTPQREAEFYKNTQEFRRFSSSPAEYLVGALRDEFRVRLAQEALMGYDPRQYGSAWPAPITPYEMWQFFEKQCTEIDVALLPVPVRFEEFLKKVGTPKPEELKDLYEKHKDFESFPGSPQAGFKRPAQIKVQWVQADPLQHKEEAARAAALMRVATQVGLAASAAGEGAAFSSPVAVCPSAIDVAAIAKYEFQKDDTYSLAPWTDPNYLLPLLTKLARPEMLAAAVGQAVANVGTPVAGPAALVSLQSSAAANKESAALVAQETARRAEVGSTLLLSGAGMSPLTTSVYYDLASSKKQYLPYQAVAARLKDAVRDDLAQRLADQSLSTLEAELKIYSAVTKSGDMRRFQSANSPQTVATLIAATMGAAANGDPGLTFAGPVATVELRRDRQEQVRQAAEAVLAGAGPLQWNTVGMSAREQCWHEVVLRNELEQAIRRLGLREGASDEFHDIYDIVNDKGLAPLKEEHFSISRSEFGANKARRFGEKMFLQGSPLYSPDRMPPFLHWKTAEKPAFVPPYAEVEDKVLKRWQLEKARAWADKEAKKIAEEAQKAGGDPERVLKDAGKRLGTKVYDLKGAARVKAPKEFVALPSLAGPSFSRFTIPEETIEFPLPDTIDKLTTLKQKGQTLVFYDQPQENFYVAALVSDPSTPSLGAFANVYEIRDRGSSLLQQLAQEDKFRQEYRDTLIAELRIQAGLKKNQDTLKSLSRSGDEGSSE